MPVVGAWAGARAAGADGCAAMAFAATVHHVLRAAETVDRLGDKAVAPCTPRPFDLRDPLAAGAFGFLDDAAIGCGQRLVGEERARRRQFVVR